jgi:hypothetical protein
MNRIHIHPEVTVSFPLDLGGSKRQSSMRDIQGEHCQTNHGTIEDIFVRMIYQL